MREEAFREWMRSLGTMGVRPISDAMSRCRRICTGLDVDLDSEFIKDGGKSLLSVLEYTANDVKSNSPVPSGLYFKPGADIKNGMASLKAAAKKYFEFCESST